MEIAGGAIGYRPSPRHYPRGNVYLLGRLRSALPQRGVRLATGGVPVTRHDGGPKVGVQFRAIAAGECFEPSHTYTALNTYSATDGAPLMDLTSEILDTTIAGVRVDDPALESLGATADGAAVVARIHARYERNPDE